ncbi:MAG: hypothetical protein AAGM84_05640 [Pseudomonadota bacterium]
MRSRDQAILDHYAERNPRRVHLLVWLSGKDRTTGDAETIGLWTGPDHTTFDIDGVTRTYYGAGSIIEADPFEYAVGLEVRTQRLVFSGVAPEVMQATRAYDPRLAPVEMHEAHFHPETGTLLAAPERVYKGFVDLAPEIVGPDGASDTIELELVGTSFALRRALAVKKSRAALRARAPADAFRDDITVTGVVECYWGEARAAAPAEDPPTDGETPVGIEPPNGR